MIANLASEMMKNDCKDQHRVTWWWLSLCVVFLVAPAVQADVFRDIRRGLTFAGFSTTGSRDYIGDGYSINAVTVFPNTPIDIGIADFSISGPLSMEVYAGGRVLPTVKLRFQTALDSNDIPQPLTYALSFDAGGQQSDLTGSLLVDGEFSFNRFGFYDLELAYSSRQTIDRDGSVADDTLESDFDIGPLRIRGNVVADVLAALATPLLGSDPDANPFIQFSGQSQLKEIMAAEQEEMIARMADGVDVAGEAAFPLAEPGLLAVSDAATGEGGSAVPEPAALLLLLLGVPFALRNRRSASA
ncbi:MAG: PEP-CTERM sorting domain-containing protein [Phycisphaerae bacterium]